MDPAWSVRSESSVKRGCQAKQKKQTKRLKTEEDDPVDLFDGLENEVVLKILSCLSATDLAALACVNRCFHTLASTNSLWHRLYTARWKELTVTEEREGCWKLLYFQKEGQDTRNILSSVEADFADMFKEMQRARRCVSLGPCSFELMTRRSQGRVRRLLSDKARLWLKKHGFNETDVKEMDSVSKDNGPFVEIDDDCFVCAQTGMVHVCDDRCLSKLMSSGQKVCPISGKMTEVGPCYEEMVEDKSEEEEETDFTGRLGRAYTAGYDCSDEREFLSMWNTADLQFFKSQ